MNTVLILSSWRLHLARFGALALSWAVSSSAFAGIQSPCTEPIVLPNPKVHVFILPYRAHGKLSTQGRELATIVQRHVLFAALKYRSIAIAELTGQAEGCEATETMERVQGRLADGQTAIFLWGRLFEQGDSISLQSTVAFSTRGRLDELEWALGPNDEARTSAEVPTDPVLFAPRRIPLFLLEQLEPAHRAARRLHLEPSANSSYFELPDDPDARIGYEVRGVKGDWMHIRLFPHGGEGWIEAHTLAGANDLKGHFPELWFVDGLVGYHQLWKTLERSSKASDARTLEWTRASFDRYLTQSTGRAESEVRALAAVLKGNASLRAAGVRAWGTDALLEAQREYARARELAPASTTASNFFLACSAALCARGTCQGGADRLHHDYLEAVARDPTSVALVENLATLYHAAEQGRIKLDATPAKLLEQRAITQKVKASIERR